MLMRMKDVDTVVHLAALINVDFSAKAPEHVFDVNLNGTLVVLEAARKLDKPVIFASSSEVYGTAQERAMNEKHQLNGQSPYAASKIAADRACKAWNDTYGMDIKIMRLFNTFGPHQANDGYGGVIAKFTSQAIAYKPMSVYGTGEQRRDYLWVDDAVDAYILALSSQRWPGPVNFGTGTTVSVMDIATRIYWEIHNPGGKYAPHDESDREDFKSARDYIYTDPRPGEVDCLRCDATKARSLGWEPKTAFQEGIHKYVGWAKSNV